MVGSSQPERKVLWHWKSLPPSMEPTAVWTGSAVGTSGHVFACSACKKTLQLNTTRQKQQERMPRSRAEATSAFLACASLCRESKDLAGKKKRSRWPSKQPGDFATPAAHEPIPFQTLTIGAGRVGHGRAFWSASRTKTKSGPVSLRSPAMF